MRFFGMFAIGSALAAAPIAAQAQSPAPPTPQLSFAFEEYVTLAGDIGVGATPVGKRNIVPITGGTFSGPGIKGTIIPGGWDWQLGRADGCLQIEANYMLRTDDGVVINVINKGVACPPGPDGKFAPIRTLPVFEAPLGKYEWLGKTAFIGTLDPAGEPGRPAVRIQFYKVQ